MFFISLKFCVIFSVIIIKSNANSTVQHSNIENVGVVYSDSGISNVDTKPQTKQNSSSNNSSVNVSHSASISLNLTSNVEKHSRGVHPTENENSNSTTKSNDEKSAATNLIIANKNENQSVAVSKPEKNPVVVNSSMDKTVNSTNVLMPTTNATSTTTTTSTTTPKTTTTTAIPKKPTVTFSVEDFPDLVKAAEARQQIQISPVIKDAPDEPISLQSAEKVSYLETKTSNNYVMSIIGMIVVVPFVVLITNCTVRHVKDYWSKRKYRRMDYLIEDMYN